ncbi:peroxisome proliferator-activated receptor alpha-like isoform 1-T1 [Salvelinus alpinus]
MPQSEKLKPKAESPTGEREVGGDSRQVDHKTLVRQIHEAYMKNFNMNKAKACVILTGKICTPYSLRSEEERLKDRKRRRKQNTLEDDVEDVPPQEVTACHISIQLCRIRRY